MMSKIDDLFFKEWEMQLPYEIHTKRQLEIFE